MPLKGITWDHPRAWDPVLAITKEYSTRQRSVDLLWKRRSLQEFADQSIAELASHYDLVVLDHPCIGEVAARSLLVPLEDYIDTDISSNRSSLYVGKTWEYYYYRGHLWAFPIDAAAQVAAYRPDLFAQLGRPLPRTWDEVIALGDEARSRDLYLGFPLIPVDCLMSFLSICASLDAAPNESAEGFVPRWAGLQALEVLRKLVERSHPASRQENPIRVLDRMASGDETPYCPLTFGYSNYSRPGFRKRRLQFSSAVSPDGSPLGGILGGAGIAVSAASSAVADACAFAAWATSAKVQRGSYARSGGQPAHVSAWGDSELDELAGGFFSGTLLATQTAYLRPRFDGFVRFQTRGGHLVHDHLFGGAGAVETFEALTRSYEAARP